MRKKLIFLALFSVFYTITHAQRASWMLGTWQRVSGNATGSIKIDNVSGGSFSGTKTTEIGQAKITIAIAGAFRGRGFYLQDGGVLHQEGPGNTAWPDCSACSVADKMIIKQDSLMIISTIADCDVKCDGEVSFFRLLSEYDSTTQRYLVDRFGRPSDIIGFQPFRTKDGTIPAEEEDTEPIKTEIVASTPVPIAADAAAISRAQKMRQDSLDNIARVKQQRADSISLAAQKKRQQQITDSLNLVQQKQQQRIKDSLANVARLEQIRLHTEDSLRDVQAKKRQQEIADSISLAQQKEQQRIKDSLANVARIRQQQINDSTLLAQQKKRQQEIADSLNLVQQREQQRIKDSLANVARLEQIRLHTEDSIRDVQAKKRQQEIADSISLAQQKEQQRIKDSLQAVAAANLQKQRTADSLLEVQARKREQAITDSLAAVRKQQYNDSLQQAALAKKAPPATSDQAAADKALTSRTSVLLQTYHITSPDILIELFDNGEIDGDRVSIYHNNENIVSNQVLGTKPITLKVHADTSHREHEFVMVAENLGTIPPNSALMRITAGKQTYKLSVNTDMKTNARIVFYYDGD